MKTVCLLAVLATSALIMGCDDTTKPVATDTTGATPPAAPAAGAKGVTAPPVSTPKAKMID